jgi:hypothetical protein
MPRRCDEGGTPSPRRLGRNRQLRFAAIDRRRASSARARPEAIDQAVEHGHREQREEDLFDCLQLSRVAQRHRVLSIGPDLQEE